MGNALLPTELASLRRPSTPLINLTSVTLLPSKPLTIISSSRTEVTVTFGMPRAPVSFGVSVCDGMAFFVNFTARNASAPFHEVEIGLSHGGSAARTHQRHQHQHQHPAAAAVGQEQEQEQEQEEEGSPAFKPSSINRSLARPRSQRYTSPVPPLRLSPLDVSISMRVFVDNDSVECYWQGGRSVFMWCVVCACARGVRMVFLVSRRHGSNRVASV
jgi:hypothetical protein